MTELLGTRSSIQELVHAILIDEKTVWIVLIAFLSHSQHLIPNKTVVAKHLP